MIMVARCTFKVGENKTIAMKAVKDIEDASEYAWDLLRSIPGEWGEVKYELLDERGDVVKCGGVCKVQEWT
jgi:hypothetical protein